MLATDHARVVHPVDGKELDGCVVVQEVVEAAGAEREGRDELAGPGHLPGAGERAGLEEVHHAVGDQLGVQPEVAVVVQHAENRVRDRADPGLDGCAVGNAFGDERGDLAVPRPTVGGGGTSISG